MPAYQQNYQQNFGGQLGGSYQKPRQGTSWQNYSGPVQDPTGWGTGGQGAYPAGGGGISAPPAYSAPTPTNPNAALQIVNQANQQQQASTAPPPPTPSETAWTEYLTTDPFYSQTVGQLSAAGQTDAAERARRIQQMLVQFGDASGFTGDDITQTVRDLASENTSAGLSTLARLRKSASDARQRAINQLAARGILQSGETGYQTGELALQAQQAEFDARNSVLDQFAQAQYGFNSSEIQRQLARISASFEAAQRAAARGVGPLTPGYGQPAAGGRGSGGGSNPYAQWGYGEPNQAYQPPPGYHFTNIEGQLILQADPPPPYNPAANPGIGDYGTMQDYINAWGGGG